MKKINIQKSKKNKGCKCKNIIKNVLVMLVMIAIGVGLCLIIKTTFTTDMLIPAVMVFSVFLISVFTDGYVYGILASVVSVIIVNFAFIFPYFKIDFLIPENITSAIIMIAIAFITCGFTSKIKHQEMLKKESEMEKMRANLLRAVSHDFRTPLTTIYGASSALIESGSEFTDEQKEKMLRGIQQDSQWLYRMVENLLSITRLDGDIKLIKTPIALDELIDSVLIKFAKRYPDQEVEVNLPDELVIIPMDAILIEQVIINILENAVQHAEGMKKLALNVKCDGDRVVFEVQDDGDGIPEDRLKHLFDGSLLGDSSDEVSVDCRQRRNAGIGLSVCATIIKAHGGDISAYNSAEGGAVFRFTLKIEEVTDEQ
jgi:two-component system sensor histidine kinase KdpD